VLALSVGTTKKNEEEVAYEVEVSYDESDEGN